MTLRVVVEADGGSRGNPGPAGYGAVVFAEDGRTVLAERHESIGTATNNVAEYRGLIAGLEAAAELGATEVAVRMDSKLVVEQMSGRWQIKHPDMRPLARRATELCRALDLVTFEWIPRERNKHADRLANEAMDGAAGVRRAASARPAPLIPDDEPSVAARPAADPDLARRVRDRALLTGEFTLRSGQVSDHYFDKYLVESDPALLRAAAAAMAALVPAGDVVLAGLELGGIPLVTMLGQLTDRPIRFVRKEAKTYGTAAQVEGGPVAGSTVVAGRGRDHQRRRGRRRDRCGARRRRAGRHRGVSYRPPARGPGRAGGQGRRHPRRAHRRRPVRDPFAPKTREEPERASLHGYAGFAADEPTGRSRRSRKRAPRKVRAPQGRVVVNGNPRRLAGKCHRKQTAADAFSAAVRPGVTAVRVKRWCKRPPASRVTATARQTPPGARSRGQGLPVCAGVRGRPARACG